MRHFARFTLSALLSSLFFLTLPLTPSVQAASTRLVSTTGSDSGDCTASPCATISYALSQSALTGGDIISVAAGTYTTAAEISIDRSITISGAGASSTIVQAAASAGTADHRLFKNNNFVTTIQNMTIRYGVEASGGAINNANGTLTLNNVTVSDNQVKDTSSSGLNGGAISINGGTLTLNNSIISSNSVTTSDALTSRGNGGGIFLGSTGTVNLNNSTVSGNSAKRGGGGLYTNGGTININYSTIANNTSDSDNDAVGDGGGVNRNSGTINLKSSIVAGNKKSTSSPTDNDCSGTITSQGYNLTGSSTGCSISGTGDTTVSPSTVFTSVLGSLSDNGGSTYTHALIVGGAAVDVIPSGTNSCGTSPFDYDQRGGTRPYNSNCDMGAYELKTVQSVSTTGTDSGDCTITDCLTLTYAYSKSQAGNTINVAAGTYTTSAEISLDHGLTISGAGASSTIVQAAASAGTADHRLFKNNNFVTTIQNMTIRYGVEASGGAINNANGNLTLNNVTLSDNQVKDTTSNGLNGGAISINGGTLTLNNSTISSNSVTTSDTLTSRGNGGGIFLGSTGTVNLNNSTVSGNSAKRGGGGLYTNGGTININYSTIVNNTSDSDNDAVGDGGGVNRNSGTINLKSSIVAGNKKSTSSPTDSDCSGTITSQGYNLTGSSTGCSISGTGDVTVTPSTVFTSVLGSLADNGGTTYTHLLYGGNAAQDAIPSGTNSCGSGTFAADQRGNTRPYNSNCDMGAYESQDAAPAVSMSSTASNPTAGSPIPVTVTFSESVTGFTAGDITAGNGTVSNFAGSSASYTFDLTPSGDGTVTADIAAGAAQDSVYNNNSAATQFSRTYDTTAPTVTSFSATSPTNSLNIPITAFTATDTVGVTGYLITQTNSQPSSGDSGWTASAPTSYTVSSAGSYTLYPWAKDAAGNVSAVYGSPASVTVDITAPTVTSITRLSSNPTNASSVDFIVGFSESGLTGIDTSDFTLTTTGSISGASVTNVSAFAAVLWTVTVNTGSGDGTIRLDLTDNDTIADAAGNKLGGTGTGNGSFTSGQAYTIDKTSPAVVMSSTAADPTNTSPIPVTITFSESVTSFTAGDITPGNATVGNFAGSGTSYSFDLTPSGNGSVTADIVAGVAQDSAGNSNTAATQFSRLYDTIAPSVTSFTATSPSSNLDIPITAFTASDDDAVGGYLVTESSTPPSAGAGGWTASAPTSYTVAGAGNRTLYPWAKDAAGNVSAVYGSPASVSVCLSSITVTSNADSGAGTLRQAIADACSGGTVNFHSSLSGGTIHLASTLTIAKSLTIDGSSLLSQITISGDSDNNGTGDVRVFYIDNVFGIAVTLDSLIVTKGQASGAGQNGEGGAVLNQRALTIRNSTFSNNSSSGSGGAISAHHMVTIIDSTFSGNSSADSVGGGGVIYNVYFVTIKNSTFSGNSANASGGVGGAILNTAQATIANSTFVGNTAAIGGAILTTNDLTIVNSTIAGNTAGYLTGGLDIEGHTTNLSNTIIANNFVTASGDNEDCLLQEATANFGTNTNNLVEDGSCSPSLSGDPKLGALADNGGPTLTFALLAGSSAIDAGDDTICAASPVSNLDQRGVTRPNSLHCDIGAYEYEDASAPTVTAFTATSPTNKLNIPITAFTASDDATVAGYLITQTSTPPSTGAAGWAAAAPTTYTVGSAGSYTLYPWVKDAVGNVSAVYSSPASVTVDKTAPTAGSLVAANITTGGGTTYSFTVTFSDDRAIDGTSLDGNDIRVTGPGGFNQLATLVSVTPSSNSTPRTATYQITAPGGTWDIADRGTYTVAAQANQVFDSAGNPVGATSLGSFMVSLNYTVYLPLVLR